MSGISGVEENMYSIIYAFSRMIEYHDSKDDTLKHFSIQSIADEKPREKFICLTKQIIQEIFFLFF